MDKLPLLPRSLLQSILGFAVPGYAEGLAPAQRTVTIAILKELGTVAKSWAGPLRQISQQYHQSALTLVFKTASRRERNKMYRKVAKRGNDVTDLYVCMGSIADFTYSRHFSLRPSLQGIVEGVHIDWSRIFANLPELKVLSLAEMPLDSRHVVAAFEAASMYCPKVGSLTLPYAESGGNEEHVTMVLKKLCESLKRLRVEGNIGGLRCLKVPTRTSDDPFRASEEFFGNVMTNCPQVEYLDRYKMSLFTSNRLACKDTWLLKVREWEKFNATCKNLREFHWVVVPFGDPYFRVFGEHIKPRLRKLSFGVSMDWDWR